MGSHFAKFEAKVDWSRIHRGQACREECKSAMDKAWQKTGSEIECRKAANSIISQFRFYRKNRTEKDHVSFHAEDHVPTKQNRMKYSCTTNLYIHRIIISMINLFFPCLYFFFFPSFIPSFPSFSSFRTGQSMLSRRIRYWQVQHRQTIC